jgi:hypothetical protein
LAELGFRQFRQPVLASNCENIGEIYEQFHSAVIAIAANELLHIVPPKGVKC